MKDRGLGDTVARVTKATGLAAVVKRVLPECGCDGRQLGLNSLVPYGTCGEEQRRAVCLGCGWLKFGPLSPAGRCLAFKPGCGLCTWGVSTPWRRATACPEGKW